MKMSTDNNWKKWAEKDPYFGVVSHEQFHGDRIKDHKAEFFLSGVREITRFVEIFEQTFSTLNKGRALDFGCGVGRLSLALSQVFEEVVGLDIADGMLAEAKQNAKEMNRTNVRFERSDDLLSNAKGKFDFVNSFIVLQHIPEKRGLEIIRQLIEKLKPGGGLMLHVSTRRELAPARQLAYFFRHNVPYGNYLINLLAGKPLQAPPMQMNEYELPLIIKLFHESGMSRIVMDVEYHTKFQTVALFARKPA